MEEIVRKYGWHDVTTLTSGEEANKRIRAAIREAVEMCAKEAEAPIARLEKAANTAQAAGRFGVASCRISDGETCERVAAAIRKLAEEGTKG